MTNALDPTLPPKHGGYRPLAKGQSSDTSTARRVSPPPPKGAGGGSKGKSS